MQLQVQAQQAAAVLGPSRSRQQGPVLLHGAGNKDRSAHSPARACQPQVFENKTFSLSVFVQWPAGAGFISPGPTGVLGRAGRQLGFSNNNDIQADRS